MSNQPKLSQMPSVVWVSREEVSTAPGMRICYDYKDNFAGTDPYVPAALLQASEEMLEWCIEAFEVTTPDFWDSPLGKRLRERKTEKGEK